MSANTTLEFDGDNSYPNCEKCGVCCTINIIAVTAQEVLHMRNYVSERHIQPIDWNKKRCCFQRPEGTCLIWEARPQVCRLYNCHIPRLDILKIHTEIQVPGNEDLYLIDLDECFLHDGFERYAKDQPILH